MAIPASKVSFQTIDEAHAGQRLDNFLLGQLKGVPKSHIYRLIRKGEVRVNKKRTEPSYHLALEDVVRIPPVKMAEPTQKPKPSQGLMELLEHQVIFEDKNLLIINKPSGLAVHGGSGVKLGLIEALRQIRPKEKSLELAHRLDRDTSGLLIIAKKASVLKELHQLLREGEVQKKYLTLLKGKIRHGRIKVDAPLKKFELQGGERMVRVQPDGKSALTFFNIKKIYGSASLAEVELMTGRTHQIRVHAQHIEHPIAGDEKYGEKDFNKALRAQGLKRLFLHASELIFRLSNYEDAIHVRAALPDELAEVLAKL